MGVQRAARMEELRSLFRSFDKGTGVLRAADFEALLDAQRLAEDSVDPLPRGFAASVFAAWTSGENQLLTEESFIHGYQVYLKQHDLWIQQWLQASPELAADEARRLLQICADLDVAGECGVSEEQFGDFCARWAEEVGEVPPPRAFSKRLFELLSSEGHFQPQLKEPLQAGSWSDPLYVYAVEWRRWLRSWLEGRRKELCSRQAAPAEKLTELASTACPSASLAGESSGATGTPTLPGDDVEEVRGFEALFARFDSGGRGYWSVADVNCVCRLLWRQDGRTPPPDAFGHEVLRYMRSSSPTVGAAQHVEGRPGALTLEEARSGWFRFRARRHDILERWASERYGRSVFACPCCQGHFTLRLESSGLEVAAVADTGAPSFQQACARTAADLLPPSSTVAALHDGISSAVGQGGALAVALPRGTARPALHARLLLEASSGHPNDGAVMLVASEAQLHLSAALLTKLAPEQEVFWLQREGWRPKPGATPPLLLSTSEILQDASESGRLQLVHVGCALCSCVEAEIPPVAELVASAPLRLLGASRPRVVCLLDEESQVHQAFMAHVEAIKAAREHLKAAFGHLQAAEREFATDDTTAAAFQTAAQQVLLEGSVCP